MPHPCKDPGHTPAGYSELYVPFCGLATIEQLSGIRTGVEDPCLSEVQQYGYQVGGTSHGLGEGGIRR